MRTSEIEFQDQVPFYKTYINVLGDVDLNEMLESQLMNFPNFIDSLPDDKLGFAYAEGKWTIAEVLLHIIDSERVFQYRALRFSRGDKTKLSGFDQDLFVSNSNAALRSKESLKEEYRAVRKASIALFAQLDRSALSLIGESSNLSWSVAALGFVICGHQKYHRNMIRERYLTDKKKE